MFSIILPAAGRSSRMQGRDKLLEPVNARPCLSEMIARAAATGAEVIVVLPPFTHPFGPARHQASQGAQPVIAPEPGRGLSHSLQTGIQACPPSSMAAMILPPDMPDLTTEDMNDLLRAFIPGQRQILQASTENGTPGHPVLFDRHYFPAFQQLSADRGAAPILQQNLSKRVLIPLSGDRARLDLDTPQDWHNWRAPQR